MGSLNIGVIIYYFGLVEKVKICFFLVFPGNRNGVRLWLTYNLIFIQNHLIKNKWNFHQLTRG